MQPRRELCINSAHGRGVACDEHSLEAVAVGRFDTVVGGGVPLDAARAPFAPWSDLLGRMGLVVMQRLRDDKRRGKARDREGDREGEREREGRGGGGGAGRGGERKETDLGGRWEDHT